MDAASSPPVPIPPGHFAVNVPLPDIFLPELIIRRHSEAVAAEMDALVISVIQRHDGSSMVKVSVAKQFAISLYKKEHGGTKVPEAKAVGALIVRRFAELIIARLKSSLEIARAVAKAEPSEEGSLHAEFIAVASAPPSDNGAFELLLDQQRLNAELERRKAVCAGREFEQLQFPLHAAAASGRDDAVVDLLLARGGCARYVADAVDGDGLTALHHAAAAGQALCVAALLDSGAMQQVQTPLNPTAVTPMLLAAAHGREDCVRLLAAHNPSAVNACDANGVTPLMMASAHASLPAVDALLQAGARPSVVDVFGRSALHRAAAAGGGRNRFDAIKLTENRNSHASEAVPDHPTGAVIALLTRDDGILVDAFDHAGYTALHVAASASDASAVAALCTAGARFDTRASNDDDDGEKDTSPYSCSAIDQKIEASIAKTGCSRLLLSKLRLTLPAHVHRQGVTPLHIVAAVGNSDVMLAMIRCTQEREFEFESGSRITRHKRLPSPSLNVKDARGRSALHVAAASGSEACVNLLIQASASVDVEDSDKVTPLAIASACGHKNVVAELIKAGADLMVRDIQGRTALHRCALAGHPVVASILVDCILLHWRAGVDCINVVKGSRPQFCTEEQRAEMEQQGAWPWLWAPAFVDNTGRLPLDYVTAVQDKLVVSEMRSRILGSHLRTKGLVGSNKNK